MRIIRLKVKWTADAVGLVQRFAAKRRQGLNHYTFYEEPNFKYTTFLSYEAQNPCLRLGAVMPSLFFSVRLVFGRVCRGQPYSLASFGCGVAF
jgi:hypothetical protein